MNDKLLVYMAGDISKSRWRLEVIKECIDLPIEFLSPIDDVSYSYQSLVSAHQRKKVFHQADTLKIKRADIIFAYFKTLDRELFNDLKTTLYSGTSFECGVAYILGKPVIFVCDMPPAFACKYELVARLTDPELRCESLDEGIDRLRELAWEMQFLPKED